MSRIAPYQGQSEAPPISDSPHRAEKPVSGQKRTLTFAQAFRERLANPQLDHNFVGLSVDPVPTRSAALKNANAHKEEQRSQRSDDLQWVGSEPHVDQRRELAIARVSKRDGQNPALQLDALKRALCVHNATDLPWLQDGFKDDKELRTGMWECRECNCEIHWEKVSTKKPLEDRPVTDAVIKKAQRGERITVWKLDRLGRTTLEMLHLFEDFSKRGIEFRCLTTPIDTSDAMGRALLVVMLAFAQLERDINSERTRAGVAMFRTDPEGNITKAWGRKCTATPAKLRKARELLEEGNLSAKEVYGALGVSRTTFYRSFVPKLIRPAHPIDQFVLDDGEIEDEEKQAS